MMVQSVKNGLQVLKSSLQKANMMVDMFSPVATQNPQLSSELERLIARRDGILEEVKKIELFVSRYENENLQL